MATLTPDRLWQLTQQHLKNVLGAEKYTAYLETAVLIEKQDDLWRIGVRDEEARAWLSNGSYTAVANALSSIVGQPVRLEFFDLDLPPLERKPKDDGRPSTPEAAWKATLGELELQMSRSTFQSWLADAELLRVEGDCWVIGVRNEYAVEWLENRLNDTITRTLVAIYGQPVDLVFVVGKGVSKANGRGPEPPPNWEEPARPEPDPEVQAKVKKKIARKLEIQGEREKGEGKPQRDETKLKHGKVKTEKDSEGSGDKPTTAYVKVSRYALRFWQPILGKPAFFLWMALCENYYFVKSGQEWPDIKTLIGQMGDNNRASLLGREESSTRQGTKGAISILEEHGILTWRIEEHPSGNPRLRTHHFDNFIDERALPVLTPRQVAALLSEERQIEHALYMARYADSVDFDYDGWSKQEAWSYLLDGRGLKRP